MKSKFTIATLFLILLIGSYFFLSKNENKELTNKELHLSFLENSPLKQNLYLSKAERKQKALPPNKYFEQEYLLEMNPATGKTEPEKLIRLQKELSSNLNNRSTPGDSGNAWIERGPNNVPGRTRAILYDPNDAAHKRVFAGGVSGGLWVIDDIENSNSIWQQVNVAKNLVVSCITVDVNDSNTFYIGTGESYVGAEGTGNGIWKSTDGGVSWNHIFGGDIGAISFNSNSLLTVNGGSVAGNYPAVQSGSFGPNIPSAGVTGNLILANDGTSNASEGCNGFGSSASGKIAIIDRGSCNFTVKIKHAQDQGAIGAIIINSAADSPFAMGGTDATITIPSVMMFKSDGETLKAAMQNETVNLTINSTPTTLPVGVLIPGKFHVTDMVIRNNGGVTEIYAAVTESAYSGAVLGGEYGIYKSIDGGNSWSLLDLPLTTDGNKHMINDLMLSPNNTLWAGSNNSTSYGDGGGKVFKSTDGVTFEEKVAITNGGRVEMATSSTNSNKIYLAVYMTDLLDTKFYKTTFGFNFGSPTILSDPNGGGTLFANNQGWYDLAITVDPNNDNNVYIGGNYIYKSTNSGLSWSKVSHGYDWDPQIGSRVHVDIHNILMHPTNSNKGLVVNDGGVYYVSNWNNAQSNSNAISSRANGYNTTQFYKGAIGQDVSNEKFLGGAQDNGSNFINNASSGVNSSTEIGQGDGMYCFIDKDSQYMIFSLYNNRFYKTDMNGGNVTTIVSNDNEGGFVNIAELDDNLNILYSDATVYGGTDTNYVISRFSNLLGASTRLDLTNDLLDRSPSTMKVSPYTTAHSNLYIGSVLGQLIKVENADTASPTWSEITGPDFNGSVSSINFGANENEIMVTFHNYGVVNVKYTEDGGTTWQDKEGDLPELPVKDILMNPLLNDEVIIATDLGVWKTGNFKDANPNWVRSQNGMQDVKVTSFDLRTADNTILASTYGRGFFTGQFTGTATVNEFTTNNTITTIYPTVSEGDFIIKSSKDMINSTIQVIDINGKKVYDNNINLNNSETSISLNVEQGIYFVNITNGSIKESHKVIIK